MADETVPIDGKPVPSAAAAPSVAKPSRPLPGQQPTGLLRGTAVVFLAFATLAIAGLLVIWLFDIDFQDESRRVIRQYASEHRQIDLRFPGADYRPIRSIRIRGEDYDFSAADLAVVEEDLRTKLEQDPSNSEILFSLAEIHLLRLQALQAIDILERLRPFTPNDPKLLGALAYGYYLRSRGNNQTRDLLRSLDLFEQALQAEPDNPVLIFNAGTVAQRARMTEQANRHYTRFLAIENDTGWAVEVKVRLRELESSPR